MERRADIALGQASAALAGSSPRSTLGLRAADPAPGMPRREVAAARRTRALQSTVELPATCSANHRRRPGRFGRPRRQASPGWARTRRWCGLRRAGAFDGRRRDPGAARRDPAIRQTSAGAGLPDATSGRRAQEAHRASARLAGPPAGLQSTPTRPGPNGLADRSRPPTIPTPSRPALDRAGGSWPTRSRALRSRGLGLQNDPILHRLLALRARCTAHLLGYSGWPDFRRQP